MRQRKKDVIFVILLSVTAAVGLAVIILEREFSMIPYYIVFSLFSIPSLYFNYSLSKRAVQSHIFLYEKNPGDGEPTGYILFRGKIFGWAVYLVALGLALFALFR